jgi:site-specific DNA-methyltransferase (adenine-specific)/modification methylase
MLVESGIIEPGITLYDNKKKYAAKVMADGSIGYKNITGSIHKVGAQLEGAPSCNGWSYWHFNIEGKMMPIDYLRQKIRSGN